MIPTPVRSVPDPTVGALRLPTSMQTACDRFPRMSGYARRKDFAVSRTQAKQRFRTLALIIQVSHTPGHVNVSSTRVLGNPTTHPTGESLHGPGQETLVAVLPGQGATMVDSTHPPNPQP